MLFGTSPHVLYNLIHIFVTFPFSNMYQSDYAYVTEACNIETLRFARYNNND